MLNRIKLTSPGPRHRIAARLFILNVIRRICFAQLQKYNCYIPSEMPRKNEAVPDNTDVGTLRPDELAKRTERTEFLPLAHPPRKTQINCPVDSYNAFELFQPFFPDEQIQILVNKTSKNPNAKGKAFMVELQIEEEVKLKSG